MTREEELLAAELRKPVDVPRVAPGEIWLRAHLDEILDRARAPRRWNRILDGLQLILADAAVAVVAWNATEQWMLATLAVALAHAAGTFVAAARA